MALLTLAIVAAVVIARQILLNDLDDRIDVRLSVVVTEIRGIVGRTDRPRGESAVEQTRRIFRAYLRNNFPPPDGMLVTIVGGRPFLRSRTQIPYRIERDAELIARWAGLRAGERGEAMTAAGPIEYLAVPLRARGSTQGVFVGVVFRDQASDEVERALRAIGVAGLVALVLGSVVAWRLAGGVLRPVRRVTETAGSLTERDLSHRISVEGDDEVARLGAVFNGMLDRLETAFATQRRLVDDAGHELKTPITIVRGHIELLGSDPAEREETIALVIDELDRMGRIVNDLLLLAKAEQPDFLDLETVDLGELTRELAVKTEALAPRDWRLESSARGIVVADRQRLTQAAQQLAQNAVAHTADADAIAIGSAIADGEARLWVRDSGPGVAFEDQHRIFDRFARGSTGRRREGAGLGLSIVRAISEAHGGRVELDSRPGEGATFTIVIPADEPLPRDARLRA